MSRLKVEVSNKILLYNAPPSLVLQLKKELVIENPKYQEAIQFGRTTRKIPKTISLIDEEPGKTFIPRGSLELLIQLATISGLTLDVIDKTIAFQKQTMLSKISLRDYQIPWIEDLLKFPHGVGVAPPGCHPTGTRVLLANGKTKAVENVNIGDRLMGAYGPRTVLQLRRGYDDIYEVTPVKGAPFRVNSAHKLTMVWSGAGKNGQVIDPTIESYIQFPKWRKSRLKLLRCPVAKFDGEVEVLSLNPYFLGLLLGDGSLKRQIGLSTMDPEIATEARQQAVQHNVTLRDDKSKSCPTYFFTGKDYHNSGLGYQSTNYILASLQDMGLHGCGSGEKFIPFEYKTSTEFNRLQLLAGLIDSDGHLSNGTYDYLTKSKQLSDDVAFIARSLGFAAYPTECFKKAQTGPLRKYYRVSISGDIARIPCVLTRKQATPRKQIKNVLRTGFSVQKIESNQPYYGFTIDGDHRYLLEDFTLTRNSGKTIMGIELYARLGVPCLWLTHTGRLAKQARARASSFLEIETGIIGKGKEKIEHFTVGMVQTLVNRDLAQYKDMFGLIIVDECHHSPCSSFTEVVSSFNARFLYGLTATPYREDKLEGLMFQSLGPQRATLNKNVLRSEGSLMTPTVIRRETKFNFPYKPDSRKYGYRAMCEALTKDEARNTLICSDVIVESSLDDKNICIVLVGRIPHGELLHELLSSVLPDVGLVHSKMGSKKADEALDNFESGKLRILIATYKMLAEGFDYQPSNRLFLTAPVKAWSLTEQACGRVERSFPGKKDAFIYDYVDARVPVLNRQANIRMDVFESNENPIMTIK